MYAKIHIETVDIPIKFHIVPDDFPIPSHGILGENFIRGNRYTLDYDSNFMTVKPNDSVCVSRKIQSELLHGLSAVPPCSQTFKIFQISNEKFPCLIEAQEVDDNVIVPTNIVHTPKAWIKVFNANEDIKLIKTNKLKISQIEGFDIHKCENTTNNNSGREGLLNKALNDKILNQAKKHSMASMQRVCRHIPFRGR